jgi:hypothetical protein
MKSNKVKVIIAVVALFFVLLGGVFYYASTKLKPEEIKKLTIEQAHKVFPNAEVTLGNVDIGFGLNFKINLEKFRIDALKDGSKIEMLSVDQLVVKVPLWAILTNSGIIEIKLDAPMMNYHEFTEGNNWTYAMGTKSQEAISDANKKEEDKKADSSSSKVSGSAVEFFGKSKINVRFSDVSVKYSLRDNSNGEIKVGKFLIKGLNFESTTAFEVQSVANFVMKDNSKVSFDTLAIGQFNISDLVKNGSVTSNVNIKMSKINKTGLDMKFPDVETNVDVLLKKDGELSGKLVTSFESQNKMTANFKMTKEIEISDINVDIVLKDIAAILGLDKSIDMSKAKLSSKGNIIYTADKKINANLSFSITPGISYSKEGIVAMTTVTGEFKGKEISGRAKTEVLDGTVISTMNGTFDPNQKFDMTKLSPFEIKVSANGMKIPEKMIRAKLWDKKPVADEEKESEKSSETKSSDSTKNTKATAEAQPLPPTNVVVEWANINVGGEDFSGKGRIVTGQKTIAVDNLNFKFSKGLGKLTQTMILGKNASDSKFNFEVQNLNLNSFKAFLPPFVENFSGNFTGKVSGSATMYATATKLPTYDVTVIANATKGEIKKLNIGEYINPMLANIPVVKDQARDKQIKIDGNFETFNMKGHFTNNQYSLNSFEFIGLDKKVQVTGNGEIYPIAGKSLSVVEATFTDNGGKISELLQKNTGSKVLPMRLSGPGFDLKPDYGFTINKLAKGAIKTKGEEKIKEVVQKNIEKIVPAEAKEKVKGLLNGLFKKK